MEPTREDARNLSFSESNIKSTISGAKGDKKRKEAIEKLRKKASKFDHRLQAFIDDLMFLYTKNEFESWEDICGDLHTVDPRNDEVEWDLWYSEHSMEGIDFSEEDFDLYMWYNKGRLRSKSIDLGSVFAQIARLFLEENKYDKKEVAWGFVAGLVSKSREEYKEEIDEISNIMSYFDDKIEQREMSGIYGRDIYGVPPGAQKAIEELDCITFTEIAVRYIGGISMWHIDQENLPKNEFDAESYKSWFEKIINDVVFEETPLQDVEILWDKMKSDYDDLDGEARKYYGSVVPLNVLLELYEQPENRVPQSKISQEMNESINAVSKHLNDFSGSGEHSQGKNWTDPQLITEPEEKRYKLTDYGKLLCYLMETEGEGIATLHKYALAPRRCPPQLRRIIYKLTNKDDII